MIKIFCIKYLIKKISKLLHADYLILIIELFFIHQLCEKTCLKHLKKSPKKKVTTEEASTSSKLTWCDIWYYWWKDEVFMQTYASTYNYICMSASKFDLLFQNTAVATVDMHVKLLALFLSAFPVFLILKLK